MKNPTTFRNLIAKKEQISSDCGICHFATNESKRKVLPCHHTHLFHEACIDRWLKMQNICPLCRKSVEQVESIRESCPKNCVPFVFTALLMSAGLFLAYNGYQKISSRNEYEWNATCLPRLYGFSKINNTYCYMNGFHGHEE